MVNEQRTIDIKAVGKDAPLKMNVQVCLLSSVAFTVCGIFVSLPLIIIWSVNEEECEISLLLAEQRSTSVDLSNFLSSIAKAAA